MKKFLFNFLDEILAVLGCGCILFGLAQWNVIIAWLVAGGMLIGFAWLIGKAKAVSGQKTTGSAKEKSAE